MCKTDRMKELAATKALLNVHAVIIILAAVSFAGGV